MKAYKLYVGGYSNDYAGLYQVEYDASRNRFEVYSTNNESVNPIHILIKDNYLFTANEIDEIARVSSFKIEKSGALRLVNRIDGIGSQTCDITIGDNVIYAANYGSGNIFSIPFEEDGNLVEVMANMEHIGFEPRAHSTILSKDGKYLYEANLGLDQIFRYEVYPEGILRTHPIKHATKLADFEGPRHMTIDQEGNYLYVINEYGNSIYSYKINPEDGDLTFIDQIRLVEEVESYAADIHFGYDQTNLYASLRGPDQIVHLKVSEGKMEVVDSYDCGGKWPRSFRLTNDGKYMFITNQNSNNLTVLEVNLHDGSLSEPKASIEINRPTTVAIYNQE